MFWTRGFQAIFWLYLCLSATGRADEKSAIVAIKESGGIVSPAKSVTGWEVEFQHGGRALTDEQLAPVAELDTVVALNLRDTQITGAGLVHLKGLTGLRRLHLERTSIDDAGIANLAGLTNLEYLNLYSTKITDVGLAHLASLKNLEQLYLWQTEVTDDGVAKLQEALPELKIVLGVDLSKVNMNAKPPEPEERVALEWIPAGGDDPPNSKSGDFITVIFENKRDSLVKLYWVEYGGGQRHYGDIEPGARRLQTTYSDASWVITDKSENLLGYFRTGNQIATAVIPKDA